MKLDKVAKSFSSISQFMLFDLENNLLRVSKKGFSCEREEGN